MPAANDPRRFWSPKLAHTHLGRPTEPTEDDIAAAEDACRLQFIAARWADFGSEQSRPLTRQDLVEAAALRPSPRFIGPGCDTPRAGARPGQGGGGGVCRFFRSHTLMGLFPKNFATDSPSASRRRGSPP